MVIVVFLIAEQLLASAVGSGSISEMLVNISNKLTLARISTLAALGQTLAVITMGVLYYVVLYKEFKIIALLALGCFLVAAITYAVGKIGSNALIPLRQELQRLLSFKRWVISCIIVLIDVETKYINCS